MYEQSWESAHACVLKYIRARLPSQARRAGPASETLTCMGPFIQQVPWIHLHTILRFIIVRLFYLTLLGRLNQGVWNGWGGWVTNKLPPSVTTQVSCQKWSPQFKYRGCAAWQWLLHTSGGGDGWVLSNGGIVIMRRRTTILSQESAPACHDVHHEFEMTSPGTESPVPAGRSQCLFAWAIQRPWHVRNECKMVFWNFKGRDSLEITSIGRRILLQWVLKEYTVWRIDLSQMD
jgi:hypothetical protein